MAQRIIIHSRFGAYVKFSSGKTPIINQDQCPLLLNAAFEAGGQNG